MTTSTPPRRSLLRRIVAFFDPGEPGFLRRAALVLATLVVLAGCGLCALGVSFGRQARVRYFTAAVLLELNIYSPTERIAKDLVAQYPSQDLAYYKLLAAVYRRTGRQAEQDAVYDDLVTAMPDNWIAHSQRCWYGALFTDPARVMGSCDRSVELVPARIGIAHARRAFARIRLGDRAGAIADLEVASERWNDYRDSWADIIVTRRRWLEVLRAGGDPIDERTLRRERQRF